jgi:predicted extracellular nuclease
MSLRKSLFASLSVLLLGAIVGACGASDSANTGGSGGAGGTSGSGGGGGSAGTPVQDAASDSPTPTGPQVRIMTFNVARFFDSTCDSGKCTSSDFEETLTAAQMDAKAQRIADAVKAVNPDILMTQEYEKDSCLQLVQSKLGSAYPSRVFGDKGYKGYLNTGLISKGTVVETRHHADDLFQEADGTITTFSRDLLEVLLDFSGHQVLAFSAHFRSKSSDDPARRLAEAKKAREIILARAQELPNAIVVLGGDLNDTPGSDPINALTQNGGLLRVASDLPASDDWTYAYNGSKDAIDHIMLAPTVGGSYVGLSAKPDRDANKSTLGGSDHCALQADFKFGQ